MVEWRISCNGKAFGIDLELEVHYRDLAGLIEDKNSELFLLINEDRVVGYMGAIIFQSPLGKQKICQEHYWFVGGGNRGRCTLLLYRAIREWAKEKGCSHLIMSASCLASNMHDRLCNFYSSIGFDKFETSFIKEL